MNNERMKILQLLQSGKITTEQADELLDALADKPQRGPSLLRAKDRVNFDELKNIGAQVSSALSQSLQDAKKAIEQQVDHLRATMTFLSVSKEIALSESIQDVSVETINGKVQVGQWDKPYVNIVVRAQVRANQLSEARDRLEESVLTHESDGQFQLEVKRNGPVEAHVDIFVPATLGSLKLTSQNGGIHVDKLCANELNVDTRNGAIRVYHASIQTIKSVTDNGSIDLTNSLSTAKSVYLVTKNGKISITGVAPSVLLRGEAMTEHGKVDIQLPNIDVQREDGASRNRVRFEPKFAAPDAVETELFCETRHGSIRIEPM